jgi:hypothetical protein
MGINITILIISIDHKSNMVIGRGCDSSRHANIFR